MTSWVSREELLARLDALIWIEEQLFELAGRGMRSPIADTDRQWCAATAQHHAWRAAQLRSIRPYDVHLVDEGASAPMPDVRAGWVSGPLRAEILRATQADPASIPESLRGQLIPCLIIEYARAGADLDPIRDQPVFRVLRIVSFDLAADLSS